MTDYAGEQVAIVIDRVKSGHGVALTADNISTVTVIIYDSDGNVVLPEEVATWDATVPGWYYDWDTSDVDAGGYIAEVHINSLSGAPGIEYVSFYLARSPVPVPA